MNEEKQGASEAENLLEELGFNALPIKPESVAHKINDDTFKLVFESRSFNSELILGKAIGNDRGAVVYINSKISDPGRYNFTAAHELGHVCMHIMTSKANSSECGTKELYSPYNDPVEQQANGFASGLLMPKQLINPLTDGEINWQNISKISEECKTSLEATVRRFFQIYKTPAALVIHNNNTFKRFVTSDNFGPYILQSPLSNEQYELCADGLAEDFSSDFETVDAEDWVNPSIRNETLKYIYSSSVSLKAGFVYTLLKYDDDCFDD